MTEDVTIPAQTITILSDPAIAALAAKEAADLTLEQQAIVLLAARLTALESAGTSNPAPVPGGPAIKVSHLEVDGDIDLFGQLKIHFDDRINPATGKPYRAYAAAQWISMAINKVVFQIFGHTVDETGVRHDHGNTYGFGATEINQRKHHDPEYFEDADGMSRKYIDHQIFDVQPSSRLRLFGYDLTIVMVGGKPTVVPIATPTPKPPVPPA